MSQTVLSTISMSARTLTRIPQYKQFCSTRSRSKARCFPTPCSLSNRWNGMRSHSILYETEFQGKRQSALGHQGMICCCPLLHCHPMRSRSSLQHPVHELNVTLAASEGCVPSAVQYTLFSPHILAPLSLYLQLYNNIQPCYLYYQSHQFHNAQSNRNDHSNTSCCVRVGQLLLW